MTARIIAANFRDLSYIAANLREDDRREAEAQFGSIHYMDLAAAHLRDRAYVVTINGNPDAAFGAARIMGDHLWLAWSWGTKRIGRAVPIITRFVLQAMIPDLVSCGAQRVEARALADHFMAQRWLARMGATRRCDLPGYGRSGEAFVLFDWTKADVLLKQAEDPRAEALAADADD